MGYEIHILGDSASFPQPHPLLDRAEREGAQGQCDRDTERARSMIRSQLRRRLPDEAAPPEGKS